MMSDSSDEDYMSDSFLAKCGDKRPGLLPRNVAKQYRQETKVKHINERYKTKSRTQVESEKRTEGLNNAIGSENKGFTLLQKMGYKPGMALGKKGEGRVEPVPIQLRSGRLGLGRDTQVKRKMEAAAELKLALAKKQQKKEVINHRDFRARQSERRTEKQAETDLYKSQKVCMQLDISKGLVQAPEFYFWPAYQESKAEESESEEEEDSSNMTTSEKLVALTAYLRESYVYCLWCGTAYDDQEDLSRNCPGDTSQAHDT